MKLLISGLLVFLSATLFGQLPNTDLYLFTLFNNGKTISLKEPTFISNFNKKGYNNQPYFINPREVYITSNHYNAEYTDFIKLDLYTETFYRVTDTEGISEYSPTPNAPNRSFSAVRVETDGKTQSLHLYPNDHSHNGERVLNNLSNIGYHCWLSETKVALFLVDDPMKLAIADIETDQISIVMENIGRCFRKAESGNLLFVHKTQEDSWFIKSYDLEARSAKIVTETVKGSEDFEVLTDGTIVMAKGSKLFSLHPEKYTDWQEISDLAEYGIEDITRLASSRNKLILVNNPKL